jgi:branched-chain amino acid transport system substrate-binding protein
MSTNVRNRRHFMAQATAAASALAFPLVGGRPAQGGQGRHPAPGDGRAGVFGPAVPRGRLMAIEDINKAGIKSLGGAKLERSAG